MKYQSSKSNAYKPQGQPNQKTKTLIIRCGTRNTENGFIRQIKQQLKTDYTTAQKVFEENIHFFSRIKIGLTDTVGFIARNEINIEV